MTRGDGNGGGSWGNESRYKSARPTCKSLGCSAPAVRDEYCEPHAQDIDDLRAQIRGEAVGRRYEKTADAARAVKPDDSWKQQGACRGADPNLFYPTRGEDTGPPKAICHTCPVEQICAEYAIRYHEDNGIWGGLSERERRRIRRRRNLAAQRKAEAERSGQQSLLDATA